MKNILLLVHEDPGQEARLQAALDLTAALGGHLTCIAVVPMPLMLGDFYGSAADAVLLADNARRESSNRERVEEKIVQHGISWDWLDATGDLALSVAEASVLSDLIVVNRGLDEASYPDMRAVASSILVKTRSPLVAVPEHGDGLDAGGRAVIAWNGSRQVAATMRAAVPLLKLASAVQLIEVGDGAVGTAADAAATYLSRHGIDAAIRQLRSHDAAIDAIIREGCEEIGASYCLMGAYGSSRLAEAVFGGVTRKMLSASRIPLVLGH